MQGGLNADSIGYTDENGEYRVIRVSELVALMTGENEIERDQLPWLEEYIRSQGQIVDRGDIDFRQDRTVIDAADGVFYRGTGGVANATTIEVADSLDQGTSTSIVLVFSEKYAGALDSVTWEGKILWADGEKPQSIGTARENSVVVRMTWVDWPGFWLATATYFNGVAARRVHSEGGTDPHWVRYMNGEMEVDGSYASDTVIDLPVSWLNAARSVVATPLNTGTDQSAVVVTNTDSQLMVQTYTSGGNVSSRGGTFIAKGRWK